MTPVMDAIPASLGADYSDADAADLVQDVLVTLVQTLPTFRYDATRGKFRQWLRTLLLNKLRQRKRRESRQIDPMIRWGLERNRAKNNSGSPESRLLMAECDSRPIKT
jgi:DNA-directed RNA polymerase specialized sigma24 family protein